MCYKYLLIIMILVLIITGQSAPGQLPSGSPDNNLSILSQGNQLSQNQTDNNQSQGINKILLTEIILSIVTVFSIFLILLLLRQRKSNREILENEIRLATLFEQSNDAIWMMENACIIDCNQKSLEVFAADSKAQLIGKTPFELSPAIQDDGRDSKEKAMEIIEKATAHAVEPFQWNHIRIDGKAFTAIVSLTYVEIRGNRILQATVRDITANKMAKAELKKKDFIIRSASSALVTFDLDGNITYANPAFVHGWGYDNDKEIIGKPIFDFWKINDIRQEIMAALLGKTMQWDGELQAIKKDGTAFAAHTSFATVLDDKNKPIALMATSINISKRKMAELALEKRLIALTRPLDDIAEISFEDLFNIEDIQKLQDEFANATGVASIITKTDGTPITRPSNFCKLCNLIRKTEKGCINCMNSDAAIGKHNVHGSNIEKCSSGGLWDAGAGITVGGKHIANWLIGQVRDDSRSEDSIRQYAKEIGADEQEIVEAFRLVPSMPIKHFEQIAHSLFIFTKQLSDSAYQNIQQARFITERKEAESALKENERRLSTLFKNLPGIAYRCNIDNNWTMEFISDGCLALTGYSSDDFINNNNIAYNDIIHHDDQQKVQISIHNTLKTKEPFQLNYRITTKAGKEKWFWEQGIAIFNENGQAIALEGYISDITEYRRTEQALLKSETDLRLAHGRLNNFLDTAPCVVIVLDKILNIKYMNNYGLEFFGYELEEVLGKHVIKLLVPEIDSLANDHIRQDIIDSFNDTEKGSVCNVNENIAKDGKRFWLIWVNRKLIDPRTNQEETLCIGVNITEQKNLEKSLRAAQDQLKDYSQDLEKMVEKRTTQLRHEQQELTKTFEQLKNTQDQLILSEKMAALGHLIAGIAHEINSPLGAIGATNDTIATNIESTASHLPDICRWANSPHGPFVFQIINDCLKNQTLTTTISSREKRQLRQNLGDYLNLNNIDNAEEIACKLIDMNLQESVDKYLSLLKNPDSLKILEQISNLTTISNCCEIIGTASNKISKIINALRTYTHTGIEDLQVKQQVNLRDNIETVLVLFQNKFRQGIELEKIYNGNPVISAVPDQLSQVWANLIQNALQAMDYKGLLTINLEAIDNGAAVSIQDSGLGMDDATLKRIYEPFFTTKAPGEGTGLGMDIVRKIIESNNGRIDIESAVGKGTKVTVWLPAGN
ncbi:MAG: PAS domain S-box protein [Phycisphaerae bacterium]|nr:PAS domain S-box protein [Phycisphaerae bacterium]